MYSQTKTRNTCLFKRAITRSTSFVQKNRISLKKQENGRQEKHSKSHEEANWQDEDNNTCKEMGSKYSPEDSDEFKDEDFKMN